MFIYITGLGSIFAALKMVNQTPQSDINLKWDFPPDWLRFFIIIVLIIGVVFRFVNLDKKTYWNDETFTFLRISGYTAEEVKQQIDDHVISTADVLKYQQINSEKNLVDTVKGLAAEEPQHPPLYYVMARWGSQLFGNRVVVRSLSALLSLLAFPCIYWLCLELFESSLTGWIATVLIAVSPFHVLYAQEAREYSLWTVTILLSSAALLQAMRLKTRSSWLIYAATLAIGLYTYLLTVLVAVSHGVYVLIIEKFRLRQNVISYILANIVAFLAFAPWVWITIINYSQVKETMAWMNQFRAFSSLAMEWIYNLSYVFMDFWYIFTFFPNSNFNFGYGKYLIPLIIILVGYSIYYLFCQTPKRVWLFVATLVGVTALAMIIPDLISGGHRSVMSRYLIPCYLGIELCVAYLLATGIYPMTAKIRYQKLWQVVMVGLVFGGIVSCTVSSQTETWWNKRTTSYDEILAARSINLASNPLLVIEGDPVNSIGNVAPLSYMLSPKVRLLLVMNSNVPKIPDNFSNVFVLEPSHNLRDGLENNYKLELVYTGSKQVLWKLHVQNLTDSTPTSTHLKKLL